MTTTPAAVLTSEREDVLRAVLIVVYLCLDSYLDRQKVREIAGLYYDRHEVVVIPLEPTVAQEGRAYGHRAYKPLRFNGWGYHRDY